MIEQSKELMEAAKTGDKTLVELTLQQWNKHIGETHQNANNNSQVNRKPRLNFQSIEQFQEELTGNTALHEAVRCGHANCCIPLLTIGGSSLEIKNKSGKTPKDLANNNQNILDIIQRHGIDLNDHIYIHFTSILDLIFILFLNSSRKYGIAEFGQGLQ